MANLRSKLLTFLCLCVMGVSAYSMNLTNSPPIQNDDDILAGYTNSENTFSQADQISGIERNKDPVFNNLLQIFEYKGLVAPSTDETAALVYQESANRIRDQEFVYLKEVSQSGKALEKQQNGQSFLKVLLI